MRPLFRVGIPMFGVLILVLSGAATAGAAPTWCKTDPIVEIDGRRAHIYVASHEAILGTVTGPTGVRITVPAGVRHELIDMDQGFGEGYDVEFVESDGLRETNRGIPMVVDVFVPAGPDLPVRVEITDGKESPLDRSKGATNEWVTAKAWL